MATSYACLLLLLVQGVWDKDSPLVQLPHISKDLAAKCGAAGVSSVFDLIDMEVGEGGRA
jgi:pre-mRNA-splicing helicase BRR2